MNTNGAGQKEMETAYNKPWIEQRADPYVYRHSDGSYYFTASVPTYDRIVLRHAASLSALAQAPERVIWEKHESGLMSEHIWAPELHYLDGAWYLYYSASDKDDKWALRPYILRCRDEDPLEGTWEELGMIQRSDDDPFSFQDFSLDATVVEHKGERYYIWAEKVGQGKKISNLYIARMESPWKLATAQVLLTTPDYDWERVNYWVNEGPAVLKHSGKLFLTYSASDTGAAYCMGMLSIDEDADLLDPRAWKKERWPVLKTDAAKGLFGPGHNTFVKAEDGETDLCIYHARAYEKIVGDPLYDYNRHARILRLAYDETGRPVFDYANQYEL